MRYKIITLHKIHIVCDYTMTPNEETKLLRRVEDLERELRQLKEEVARIEKRTGGIQVLGEPM